jgi:hypothetical protein
MVRIGPYQIRELIGEGGVGRVHAAFDTVFEREVAIKSLRPALLNDKGFLERFRSEATRRARSIGVAARDIERWGEAPTHSSPTMVARWLGRIGRPPLMRFAVIAGAAVLVASLLGLGTRMLLTSPSSGASSLNPLAASKSPPVEHATAASGRRCRTRNRRCWRWNDMPTSHPVTMAPQRQLKGAPGEHAASPWVVGAAQKRRAYAPDRGGYQPMTAWLAILRKRRTINPI